MLRSCFILTLVFIFHFLSNGLSAAQKSEDSESCTSVCRKNCMMRGFSGGFCVPVGPCVCHLSGKIVGEISNLLPPEEKSNFPRLNPYFPSFFHDPYDAISGPNMLQFPPHRTPPVQDDARVSPQENLEMAGEDDTVDPTRASRIAPVAFGSGVPVPEPTRTQPEQDDDAGSEEQMEDQQQLIVQKRPPQGFSDPRALTSAQLQRLYADEMDNLAATGSFRCSFFNVHSSIGPMNGFPMQGQVPFDPFGVMQKVADGFQGVMIEHQKMGLQWPPKFDEPPGFGMIPNYPSYESGIVSQDPGDAETQQSENPVDTMSAAEPPTVKQEEEESFAVVIGNPAASKGDGQNFSVGMATKTTQYLLPNETRLTPELDKMAPVNPNTKKKVGSDIRKIDTDKTGKLIEMNSKVTVTRPEEDFKTSADVKHKIIKDRRKRNAFQQDFIAKQNGVVNQQMKFMSSV